jgi:cobalt-zinc-cadmium efflux system protein
MSPAADRRWLSVALVLILALMAGEVVVGSIAGSLALLSDAAHMLTDAAAIVLALVTLRLVARPARGRYTYGLKRTEALSAQINGLVLLVLSAWLGYEAVRRLIAPPPVTGGLVSIVAAAGIVINLAATWSLSKANRQSLNIRGAYLHILTDLFAFIATLVAGVVMVLTGFDRADAIAGLVVVALMVRAGISLVVDSGRIFLEAAPAGADPDEVGDELVRQPEVVEVHDLHLWQIDSGQSALSAHVLVDPSADCHRVRRNLEDLLDSEYELSHSTLQVDHVGAQDPCTGAHGPTHYRGPHEH